ncbi:MAG: histidine phosphatase family protein [bacterium]|nr:histidine phosphatase family protein [bacterium]
MKTRVLLIRHGQSANNAQPEELRVADPGLTEIGERQALATAQALMREPITHLYCSPFLRALETARPLAEVSGLPVRVRSDIFEQGGCYSGYLAVGRRGEPGMGRRELQERHPHWHIDPEISDAGWWGKDYESWEQARTRASAVAKWMSAQLATQLGMHVLIIHADFKSLLLEALGVDRYASPAPLRNTGITEFHWNGSQWSLGRLNCVRHLEEELVTH